MLRTLIIEDEWPSRENLKALLQQLFPERIRLLGEAATVSEAVQLIQQHRPDLVFLDVQLIGGSAFDVLDRVPSSLRFQTIVVTAYDHFAIRAIKYAALDYLLKPLDVKELTTAVKRAEGSGPPPLTVVPAPAPVISIATTEGTRLIPVPDIHYCSAEGSYCRLRLDGEQDLLVSKNLSALQALLPEGLFIRAHRSYLVQVDHIAALRPPKTGTLVLRSGESIPVSRRRRKQLVEKLAGLGRTG